MARGRLNLLMKFKNIHFKVLFQFFSTQNLIHPLSSFVSLYISDCVNSAKFLSEVGKVAHHYDMGELLLPANKVSWSMKPTIHLFDYMAPTL